MVGICAKANLVESCIVENKVILHFFDALLLNAL